jgi:amino acid transporter
MEKEPDYRIDPESPNYGPGIDDEAHKSQARRGSKAGEANEIFGDAQTAEEYGYVTRGLKSRHIQFIALGGTIGTGLFLGIGRAFTQAGPLSVLLGYTFTGIAVFAMMMSLGEMATWLPLPGAIPQFSARYVDDAVGFAVGWNQWYNCASTLCAEISAASTVIQFWHGAEGINVSAWITIIIVVVICLNIFAVAIYGEAEFIFASVKILTIVGLLLMAFIVDLGGGPDHDRRGFRYWNNPGAMKPYIDTGDSGRFLGLFSTLVNAAFSYGGVEMVAVAAGEAENPHHNIPKAVKRVFWRILFFYVLGSLAIGVLVPYNDDRLLSAISSGAHGAAASPWVIAIYRAGIPVLPHIINAVILTSASSSANAFLYTGSRYLYALAQNRQAPRFLLRCSKSGVPYWCVMITASISLLTYMSASAGSTAVFTWFQNLTTIATLFSWVVICLTYVQFHKALRAQGVDRNTLVFKSPFQPYLAYGAGIFFAIIIVFNGFDAFAPSFNYTSFITDYIGVPIFFLLYGFWKILKKTHWVKPAEADIYTGKAALDAVVWPEHIPKNFLQKIWYWIA